MEDNKLSIKLQIAERTYPLSVERTDEEKYRRAAKSINEMLSTYKKRFPTQDIQDLLGMVSLHLATKNLEREFDANFTEVLQDLKEMTNELESFIIENNGL
jgi:cell division protein ZapA